MEMMLFPLSLWFHHLFFPLLFPRSFLLFCLGCVLLPGFLVKQPAVHSLFTEEKGTVRRKTRRRERWLKMYTQICNESAALGSKDLGLLSHRTHLLLSLLFWFPPYRRLRIRPSIWMNSSITVWQKKKSRIRQRHWRYISSQRRLL